jgi:hypothetical protein
MARRQSRRDIKMKTRYSAVVVAVIGLSARAALAASEGGDTWSSVEPKHYSGYAPVMTVATTARLSSLRPDGTSGKGTPAVAEASNRVVQLTPSTHFVDVGYGERVTFEAADERGTQRSFAWQFDVSPVRSHVDLDDVAPTDFPARGLRVFVAPAPEYRGG